jgi:hypothetical protein
LAVATIASNVSVGCAIASQLRRVRRMAMKAPATITDQPKCSDGIAAYWLATDWVVSAG